MVPASLCKCRTCVVGWEVSRTLARLTWTSWMACKKSRSYTLWLFLWDWAKDEVYHTKPRTLEELEARIWDVITNVPHNFLQKTVDSIPGRLRKLVDIMGAYIEF
jgi:hypothetical protein